MKNPPPENSHAHPARPGLARRTRHIAPFQVMELVKRANLLALQGKPVIHMSIGEPDFTAPPQVVAALEAAARAGRSQYTSALGIAPLRQAIADYYRQQFDIHLPSSRIIVTAGASAALSLACAALVNPGDEVLMTDPSYPCNRHFVAACDGQARLVPVGPQSRFQLTDALLREHWNPSVRGALLATPANPTGTSIPFDELGRILATLRERSAFAIVDEIYLGLSYDNQGKARSALEYGDDIIVTNSFSKYFSMTGWRLGWLVVPEHWADTFEKLAQNLYICPSSLAQYAALACFEPESMAIYEQRRLEFARRRDYLLPQLQNMGFEIPAPPDGAFYIYLDCSRFSDDSSRFAAELLEQEFVSLVPGDDFGFNQPKRYLRLSYATALPKLAEAVQRMQRFTAALR
jgi:aspartate/methionine/tyrosine aminotransferase